MFKSIRFPLLLVMALALAGAKVPEAELYRGDICAPEVRSAPLDLIVSLDVIYIPGAQRARDGLRTLVEALRPGGLFVVNLPAYDWLYSETMSRSTPASATRPDASADSSTTSGSKSRS